MTTLPWSFGAASRVPCGFGASAPQLACWRKARNQGPRYFEDSAQPPAKPGDEDGLFDYECTCIKFRLAKGQQAAPGNALLAFLRGEGPSSPHRRIDAAAPIKVTSPSGGKETGGEFSVEALVCRGLHHCKLLVSFYSEEPGTYAADFRLLRGDHSVFLALFGMALLHYREQGFSCEVEEAGVEEASCRQVVSPCGDLQLAVCGEVALHIYVPDCEEMQEEPALGLARIAEDPTQRAHLCDARVCPKIRKLIRSDSMEVAWPTARLLAALASTCAETEPMAALLKEVREELREKARSDYTEAAVQELLRRTFAFCAEVKEEEEEEEAASEDFNYEVDGSVGVGGLGDLAILADEGAYLQEKPHSGWPKMDGP